MKPAIKAKGPAAPTLGPWRIELQPRYCNADIIGKRGQHVAKVWSGSACSMAVVEANAKAIAAAGMPVAVLVIVRGGVAEAYIDRPGRVVIVDYDDIKDCDGGPAEVPGTPAFRALCRDAGVERKDIKWVKS